MLIDSPKIMGILNITPDSFFDGGKLKTDVDILLKVEKMLLEGSDFIDIGGMSTRPNANEININEELNRVIPVIALLRNNFPECFLSIDTYRSEVAQKSIDTGIDIVNDISGGTFDVNMFNTIAKYKVPYIMMHIQGTPKTMQNKPQYENATQEILQFFINQIEKAQQAGISDIIIDVGFGFGKNLAHNYELLKELGSFKLFNKPIMTGLSRKSMIGKLLDIKPEDALNGSTVLHTIALLNGANILRVHDVKEAKQAIDIVSYYQLSS